MPTKPKRKTKPKAKRKAAKRKLHRETGWAVVDKKSRLIQMTDEGFKCVCFIKARANLELKKWGDPEFSEVVPVELRELPRAKR